MVIENEHKQREWRDELKGDHLIATELPLLVKDSSHPECNQDGFYEKDVSFVTIRDLTKFVKELLDKYDR